MCECPGPRHSPFWTCQLLLQWQLSTAVSMLCLCLYVPLIGEAQTEFQYFESKGLPAELKSIFKLSVFIPSQEFSTYRQWKQVCMACGSGSVAVAFVERMGEQH